MRRWVWWLLPPWGAKARRRQFLAAMREWQEEERAAARDRVLGGVARLLDEPTRPQPVVRPHRPMLTRGQAARTRLGEHRS
jgi:hypothetical protein